MARYINFLVEDRNTGDVFHVGDNTLFGNLRDFFSENSEDFYFIYSKKDVSEKVMEHLKYKDPIDREHVRDFSIIDFNWLNILSSEIEALIKEEKSSLKKLKKADYEKFNEFSKGHKEEIRDLKNTLKDLLALQTLITDKIELWHQSFSYCNNISIYFWIA